MARHADLLTAAAESLAKGVSHPSGKNLRFFLIIFDFFWDVFVQSSNFKKLQKYKCPSRLEVNDKKKNIHNKCNKLFPAITKTKKGNN